MARRIVYHAGGTAAVVMPCVRRVNGGSCLPETNGQLTQSDAQKEQFEGTAASAREAQERKLIKNALVWVDLEMTGQPPLASLLLPRGPVWAFHGPGSLSLRGLDMHAIASYMSGAHVKQTFAFPRSHAAHEHASS